MDGPSKEEIQEVGSAVKELRAEVEKKGFIDKDKIARLNDVLDTYEEKNQQLTAAIEATKRDEAEINDLKSDLEAKGVAAGEMRERVDVLEAELARHSANPSADDYRQSDEYKALSQWVREGDRGITPEQKATLRTDSAVQGGFLVTSEMDNQITKKITEIDGLRAVSRVRTISSKSIEIPIRATIPVATYEGEGESGTDSTSTYENETVTPYRQTFTTPITQDQLQDSSFDMESEIMSDSGEAFAFGEGNGFIVGTGVKQPEGITINAVVAANFRDTEVSGLIDANTVILLSGDLKTGYNPVYVMNRRTLATLRTLRGDAASAGDQAGQYLWSPGLNGPVANTINGFSYILANSMPDIAASSLSVAFGDFRRGYTIVDRTGLTVVRDEFTQKKKAIIEFTMNRWNTGRVTLPEAIKLMRIKP